MGWAHAHSPRFTWAHGVELTTRGQESLALMRALLATGYRGRVDHDGYPIDGPGAHPGGYMVRAGQPADRLRSLTKTAQAAALFDGGWDGDDNGEGPLLEWLNHHRRLPDGKENP